LPFEAGWQKKNWRIYCTGNTEIANWQISSIRQIRQTFVFYSNSKFAPKLFVVFGNLLDTGQRTEQDSLN